MKVFSALFVTLTAAVFCAGENDNKTPVELNVTGNVDTNKFTKTDKDGVSTFKPTDGKFFSKVLDGTTEVWAKNDDFTGVSVAHTPNGNPATLTVELAKKEGEKTENKTLKFEKKDNKWAKVEAADSFFVPAFMTAVIVPAAMIFL